MCIYLSVLVEAIPGVGVSDVGIGLENLLVNDALDGDLQVDLDEGGRHGVGRQLQLDGGEVALGACGVVDEVDVVVRDFEAFLNGLRLN